MEKGRSSNDRRVELYRRHSSEVLSAVKHAADPKMRQEFVELAAAWQRLTDAHNRWSDDHTRDSRTYI
jgi:hypothetical protein